MIFSLFINFLRNKETNTQPLKCFSRDCFNGGLCGFLLFDGCRGTIKRTPETCTFSGARNHF